MTYFSFYQHNNMIPVHLSEGTYLDEGSSNASDIREEIFSSTFAVERMINPVGFLPRYQQNQMMQPTCNEQCLSCCGDLCMNCSAPFGCCGCTCCCGYFLPTSYGNGFIMQQDSPNRLVDLTDCSNQDSILLIPVLKRSSLSICGFE